MAIRPDVVVFVTGVLLLGTGAFGLSTLPDSAEGALRTFSVAWRESSRDVPVGEVQLADGGTGSADAVVAEGNLTRLVFVLACADSHPLAGQNAATLEYRIEGPANQTAEDSATCGGDIEVAFEVQPAPTATAAAGTSPEDAAARLLEARRNLTTVGEWTFDLALSRATPQLPGAPVGGATVQIDARAVRHEPTVTESTLPR